MSTMEWKRLWHIGTGIHTNLCHVKWAKIPPIGQQFALEVFQTIGVWGWANSQRWEMCCAMKHECLWPPTVLPAGYNRMWHENHITRQTNSRHDMHDNLHPNSVWQ